MAVRSHGRLVYPLYLLGAKPFPNPHGQAVYMSKKALCIGINDYPNTANDLCGSNIHP